MTRREQEAARELWLDLMLVRAWFKNMDARLDAYDRELEEIIDLFRILAYMLTNEKESP